MKIRVLAAFMAIISIFQVSHAQGASSKVVKFQASAANVKYVYGPAEPVATLESGDILDTDTLDCFGNVIQKPGDSLALVKGDNPLTGPFYVKGAEPGDTLQIEFLQMDVNGPQGVGAIAPGFGAINTTNYTPMLNAPLPERIWFYPIQPHEGTATFHAHDSDFFVQIPLHPFLGCVGVAPAGGESRSSVVPAEFGGNMDAPEASVGNTLYLPINVSGALLFLGDGHAAMGDGEIAGTAIEAPMHVRLRVSVIKGKKIDWPRFENQTELMTTGIYRPLDDSLRIAFTQLVGWIHSEYGLSELDAYELLSEVGTIHLTEMVDPNYVVIAKINKKYLPSRVGAARKHP